MFSALIADIVQKFGLGQPQAEKFVRELLGLFAATPGGPAALASRLAAFGLTGDPASWAKAGAAALDPTKIADVVGADAVLKISDALHLPLDRVKGVAAFAVPKLLAALSRHGHVPASLPTEAAAFLDPHPVATPAAATAFPPLVKSSRLWDWGLRGAILALVLALLWWLTPRGMLPPTDGQQAAKAPATTTAQPQTLGQPAAGQAGAGHSASGQAAAPAPATPAAPAPAAPAPATAPAAPATQAAAPASGGSAAAPTTAVPARLALKEQDGVVSVSGVVADETTRSSALSVLTAFFGADKVKGDLTVNPQAGAASWLGKLPQALAGLKFPGLDAVFEGNGFKLNALPSGVDRASLLAWLSGLFGSGTVNLPEAPAVPAAAAPGSAAPAPAAPATASPAPAAAPATPASAEAPGSRQPRVSLREIKGTLNLSGAVPDAATADKIKSDLAAAFGAGNVKGDLTIDPRYAAPSWLGKFPDILSALKSPGFNATLDGAGIDLKALSPQVDRDKLLAALRGLFGGASVTLPEIALPNLDAKGALDKLSSLSSGYRGADVTTTLNQFPIEFATASATPNAEARAVLAKAAEQIKALGAGALVTIEGYTDDVGEEEANLKLSQARADAVKALFVEAGIPADDITATGYGPANPIASNETPEGRARNRRITYEVRSR